ncbi:MAG: hypothetical protein WCY25_06215 [Moheibacter sp.]
MKSNQWYIFFFAITLSFFFSCESMKPAQNNNVSISKINMEKSTLGSNSTVEITESGILISATERNGDTDVRRDKVSPKQWNELNRLVNNLDIRQMDTWEGPTQARFYDGAMATTITIETDGESYNSQSFDEGEPPAELKELYDYLESLVNQ